jgi:hypothetical protein
MLSLDAVSSRMEIAINLNPSTALLLVLPIPVLSVAGMAGLLQLDLLHLVLIQVRTESSAERRH